MESIDALQWLKPENLPAYFTFFIPGFIALQISGLILPDDDADYTKKIPIVIGYSALNYALMLLVLNATDSFHDGQLNGATKFAFTFVLPALYPFVIKRMREMQMFGMLTPQPKPWDFVFAQRHKRWIRLYLKTGEVLTGWYGARSNASAFPSPEQIYVQQLYMTDDATNKMVPIPSSAGAIVSFSEVKYVEFFR